MTLRLKIKLAPAANSGWGHSVLLYLDYEIKLRIESFGNLVPKNANEKRVIEGLSC